MILIILQARCSSTRLPGKVMMPVLGKPMLQRQLERVANSTKSSRVVVATSTHESDVAIENLCTELKIDCFRGDLEDVLDRFYRAASMYNPAHIIRLTGDCPLVDPFLIDEIAEFHINGGFDYSSNTLDPTYPDGLDIEIFRFQALETSWKEAKLPSEREHVTPYMKTRAGFKIGNWRGQTNLSELRWTVDEPLDFELVTTIFKALYPTNSAFTTSDILNYLSSKPELRTINTGHGRDEGYAKSLLKDKIFSESN